MTGGGRSASMLVADLGASVDRKVHVTQLAATAASRPSRASAGKDISAPRQPDFLNLHLSFLREGFLDMSAVGSEVSAFPFCYAPPAYVRLEYVSRELDEPLERGQELVCLDDAVHVRVDRVEGTLEARVVHADLREDFACRDELDVVDCTHEVCR